MAAERCSSGEQAGDVASQRHSTPRARVAGLLLAAGGGRRYGQAKALVRYQGDLLVDRAVRTLCAGGCESIMVVLGAEADTVMVHTTLDGAAAVVNHDWMTGLASSLRIGLGALVETSAEAAVIMLVDTPGITATAVDRVRRSVAPEAAVTALSVANYDHGRGHPVLMGRLHWPAVMVAITGEIGARTFLAHANGVVDVPCDDIADYADIDRPGLQCATS